MPQDLNRVKNSFAKRCNWQCGDREFMSMQWTHHKRGDN